MSHRRHAAILAVGLALALGLGRCGTAPAGDDASATPSEAGTAHLTLTVKPVNGDAPLGVRLSAALEGSTADPERLRCPSLAWSLGNGAVILSRAGNCDAATTPRSFMLDYTYQTAGSYEATVRLLAVDVPESNAVSVLVRGPTPTAVPLAAVPGPTIVIATAARPPTRIAALESTRPVATVAPATAVPAGPATVVATTVALATPIGVPTAVVSPAAGASATAVPLPAGTTVAQIPLPTSASAASPAPPAGVSPGVPTVAPAVQSTSVPALAPPSRPRTPGAPSPRPPAAVARVMPADLYYLTEQPRSLWRLPASGGPPEVVIGESEAVRVYDVAPSGIVAYVPEHGRDGVSPLLLRAPGAPAPVTIAPRLADHPIWSRDGRRLAYTAEGAVYGYDLATTRGEQLAPDGTPLAWSRDGTWLALRRPDGGLTLVNTRSKVRRDLPIAPATEVGWLPGRDVLWVAGDGLTLLTVGDTLEATTLVAPGQPVRGVFVRPDQRLLALVGADDRLVLHEVDLTAETLSARPVGPPLTLAPDWDFAWSPDGQNAAVASAHGLGLLAPGSGADLPLLEQSVRQPRWLLATGAR